MSIEKWTVQQDIHLPVHTHRLMGPQTAIFEGSVTTSLRCMQEHAAVWQYRCFQRRNRRQDEATRVRSEAYSETSTEATICQAQKGLGSEESQAKSKRKRK
eukprot:NODE_9163_length_350_cov_2.215947_g8676_i0.p2 GENE.NODE_9163_length_350_cov_2.215947_g8676_i0~~NODE_9163_length_350_cov_2.215947_g8676_i0.p2  ORF type:complete len:101 (-),score=13.47 NODE_9163_length_350_cov_2.215947_g8676_i0:47-349(-)